MRGYELFFLLFLLLSLLIILHIFLCFFLREGAPFLSLHFLFLLVLSISIRFFQSLKKSAYISCLIKFSYLACSIRISKIPNATIHTITTIFTCNVCCSGDAIKIEEEHHNSSVCITEIYICR